jgi:hypothetical protein
MDSSPLKHALECAARGWAVFPLSRAKVPRCPRGHLAATTEPERIRAMHAQFGFVLIGIRAGEESNVAVLDIDIQHGGMTWLDECRHRLPPTRVHRTRSGGEHWLFRHKPGLRCSTAKIAPGIDVKAEGGAFTYWPAEGFPVLCDAPLADWPEWLTPRPKPSPALSYQPLYGVGADKARRYATAALRHAVQRVAGTAAGGRNDILNRETFAVARFIRGGALSANEVADAMAHAGLAAGLDQREVIGTLSSAMRRAAA